MVVAKVVQPDRSQAGRGGDALEAPRQVARLDRPAAPGGEHEPGFLPLVTRAAPGEHLPLGQLHEAFPREDFSCSLTSLSCTSSRDLPYLRTRLNVPSVVRRYAAPSQRPSLRW
jgi:hypothetical protein